MGRTLRSTGWIAAAIVFVVGAACSGSGDDGSDAAAARVARSYADDLGNARWATAFSRLLPRQRASVDYGGLFMFCQQQDEATGGNGKASVTGVRDAGSVSLPAYREDLPTRVVDVTISYPSSGSTPHGKIRVSEHDGRWYVSLADQAYFDYQQGNCPMQAVWEHRRERIPLEPPPLPPIAVVPPQPAAPAPGTPPAPGPPTPAPTPAPGP